MLHVGVEMNINIPPNPPLSGFLQVDHVQDRLPNGNNMPPLPRFPWKFSGFPHFPISKRYQNLGGPKKKRVRDSAILWPDKADLIPVILSSASPFGEHKGLPLVLQSLQKTLGFFFPSFQENNKYTSWRFQPIWKICSSKWVHLPQVGLKIKNIWVATT